jgi:hypothetical protein
METMGCWSVDRLGTVIALQLMKFAHNLGLPPQRLANQQSLADEARPQKGHRKRDRD